MTEINPLAVAILASTHTQRQLTADKGRQSRRAAFEEKDANGKSEELENEVESPDIVTLIGDDARERGDSERHPGRPRKQEEETTPSENDDTPHIDITG